MKARITKQQQAFLASKSRGTIFRAGIGSGKSYVHCIRAIMKALKGRHYCIVSFSYPSLRDTVLVTLKEILNAWGFVADRDYVFGKAEMIFDFPASGGKILLRSGDRPDSLRGLNLDDFGIDEAREFKDDNIFRVMLGRLRRSADGTWCITTTPKGKNWVWELELSDNVETVTQRTEDNKFLPQAYIDELRSRYTSDFAQQEMDAGIVEFGAGVIRPEWFQFDDEPLQGDEVRFWDLAVKKGERNDFSAGGRLCKSGDIWQVKDMIQVKEEWHDIKQTIIETAQLDGPDVAVVLEDANQGYPLTQDLLRDPRMSKYAITCRRAKGEKFARAMPWVSRLEHGNLRLLRGPWNKSFIEEAISFTSDDSHRHDDMIDTISGGWQYMNEKSSVSVSFI